MNILIIKPGDEFTHDRKLDLSWKPGPGQRYKDAPRARMRVTRVTQHTIWFTYATSDKTGWYLSRKVFENAFGDQIAARRGIERDGDRAHPYQGRCACGTIVIDVLSHRAPLVTHGRCPACGTRAEITRNGL